MNIRKLEARKRIALVAHDNKKAELVEWAVYNKTVLSKHRLYATGTTGTLLETALDLSITKFLSGPLGGDQQVGARIAEGKIDVLIFFWDTMEAQPHDPDVKALLRVAVTYNILIACDRATADFLLTSPLMHQEYETILPDYSLYTKKKYQDMTITLREWKKSDAERLAKIANNREVWNNLRDLLPHPYTEKDARKWLKLVRKQHKTTTFCIEADGVMAGSIGFTMKDDVYRKTAELGYFIAEEFWGRGVATEAIRQMLEYIEKNFDLVRIYAEVFEFNKASMRALEKNGFYLEAIRKKAAIKNDVILDDYVWVKLIR